MTEQQQADALARWLARGADGPPPEGLDREVVEGLYALRPDLAPRTRVTADDILAGMTAGPFADDDDAPGNVVAFPVPASRPDGDADAEPAPVRPRPWWMAPAVGISLAAAAAAVLVIVPRTPAPSAAPTAAERAQEVAPAADAAPPPASAPAAADAAAAEVAAPVKAEATPVEAEAIPFKAEATPPAPKQAAPAARPTETRARVSRADAAPPAPAASAPAPAANEGAVQGIARGFGGFAFDDAAAAGAEPVAAERRAAPVAASRDEALDLAEEAEAPAAPPRSAAKPSAIPEVDDLPPAIRRALDDAAVLAATDPADAAASLLPRIAAPARIGQRVALAALDHAAAAGDIALQRRIVDRGVALDPSTPTAATLRARRP